MSQTQSSEFEGRADSVYSSPRLLVYNLENPKRFPTVSKALRGIEPSTAVLKLLVIRLQLLLHLLVIHLQLYLQLP